MNFRFVLAVLLALTGIGSLFSGMPLTGRAQEGTPSASPISEPTTISPDEQGPVFVAEGWRISVVAAVRAPGINAIGLRQGEDREWLVVVADVSNLSTDTATFVVSEFALSFKDEEGSGGLAKQTTAAVAGRLAIEPADVDAGIEVSPDATERVVVVYRIAENLEEPAFHFGSESVALGEVLDAGADLRQLNPVSGLPDLQEANVDLVVDGATLEVYLPTEDTNQTIQLLGVDAPFEGECFGDESIEILEDLISATVWIESSPAFDSGDGPVKIGYVWVEIEGSKVLLNQQVIARGGAALGDLEGDERYREWLIATQQSAEEQATGLWSACSEPHGEALPTPTPLPPTPTPTPPPPVGTRENPVPMGEVVDLGNGFSFRVVDVIPDAWEVIIAENQFNDPAPEGYQFFIATIEVSYNGEGSTDTGGGYGYEAVGDLSVAYESGFVCGVIPNEFTDTELFTGGTIAGNLCWQIRPEDAGSLVMYLGEGADRIYFALTREG